MFRFFENLIDPYCAYPETNTPPTRLWPFLRDYSKPFKTVFILTALMSVVVAGIEVGLIYYMGRIVDLMSGTPAASGLARVRRLMITRRPHASGEPSRMQLGIARPGFGAMMPR